MPTSMTVVETRIWICFPIKSVHDLFLFGSFHPPVDEADTGLRKDFFLQMFRHARRILEIQVFRLFDERIDDKDLISLLHLPADDLVDAVPLGL